MAQVKFWRGLAANYNATTHANCIYFTTDDNKHVIMLNGKTYGVSDADATKLNAAFKTVAYDSATGVITFTDNAGNTQFVTIGLASSEANGLMSKDDKAALDTLNGADTVEGSVANQVKKVLDALDEAIGAGGSVAEQITAEIQKLDVTDTAVTTQYVSQVSETDGKIAVVRADLVASGDKVLAPNATGNLTATLGLTYDSAAKKIKLTGKESAVLAEIDATAFIKDGMVQSAELVTDPEGQAAGTYIKITFNTDGPTTPIYINVTSLIDVYTAGNGLALEGKSFSVKVDGTSEAFLSVGADGVKLSGIQDAINTAKAASTTKVVEKAGNTHVKVTSATGEDNSTTYTIAEADIASAALLGTKTDAKTVDTAFGRIQKLNENTVNGKALSTNPVLSGADIALTGYTVPAGGVVAASDTVNAAINKLDDALVWHEAE